ncbi:MAG: hypothetical protein M1816_001904 [Peltula sp. TS41687]|nr:MAG: hypothetical protein M1816_001904 [Peltula sp. TS41687]
MAEPVLLKPLALGDVTCPACSRPEPRDRPARMSEYDAAPIEHRPRKRTWTDQGEDSCSDCLTSDIAARPLCTMEYAVAPIDRRSHKRIRTGRGEGLGMRRDPNARSGITFEGLPSEIRSMIYEFLLAKDYAIRPICHEDRYTEPPGTGRPPGLQDCLSLLRVSRRVHTEASDVLYGRNTFLLYALDFGDAILAFLQKVGRRNRQAIRNLQIDWQHGISKIRETNRASELCAMISDINNPFRKALAKMLHDVGRTAIDKFVATLELMVGSPRLEHLTILCPGTDSPGHPDNHHHQEYHGCSGCHYEVPRVLVRIRGLKSLTVGDTDWRNELEAMALEMGVQELHVTQLAYSDLPPETVAELHRNGWKISITWRDPDGDDFRRVATKRLPPINRRGTSSRDRDLWI